METGAPWRRRTRQHEQWIGDETHRLAPLDGLKRCRAYASAHASDNASACSSTVCVAFSCLSGG